MTAATEAGAKILSGPDLRIANSESAASAAYGEAFKAARARAQAYADAAGMEISRVLTIRDDGGARIMAGQTTSRVAVQVHFALREK